MSPPNSLVLLVAVCLAAGLAQSAPTEAETSTTPMKPEETSSANRTNEDPSMAVSSAQDQGAAPNTSFSCYNRQVGYYADPESDCKIYHFCMLGDYNGQEVYQRISYLCLNETFFDQQALDCVASGKMNAPCSESVKFYDESNTILRKAIIGKTEKDESTGANTEPSPKS